MELQRYNVLETIYEMVPDKVSIFLKICGFDSAKISMDKLNKVIGEENNPFDKGLNEIEYDLLYEYVLSVKSHNSILTNKKEETYKSKNSYFNFDYIKSYIVFITMGLWLTYFFLKEGPIAYKVAKGFGLNLRVWSSILVFLMCRTLLLGKVEKHISYHSFIGYIYLFCTVGHTIAHFFNSTVIKPIYISGFILLFLILIISLTSIFKINYNIFLNVHRLTYFILPLLIIHVPSLWYWFFAGILLLCAEMTYNFFFKTQISKLTNCRLTKYDKLISLSFHRVIPAVSGAYYKIMIPSISTEWHTFSLASTDLVDQLLFIVSINGDWTAKLSQLLQGEFSNKIAIITGPFFTCSTEILNNELIPTMCIAGGIGIAPFISVIDSKIQLSKINDEYRSNYLDKNKETMIQIRSYDPIEMIDLEIDKNFRKTKKEKLTVIWIVKTPQQLFKYIDNIISNSEVVNFKIYITIDTIKNKWIVLKMLENSNIECYFRKPNLEKLIFNQQNVFFCGPARLQTDVKEICYKYSIPLKCEYYE